MQNHASRITSTLRSTATEDGHHASCRAFTMVEIAISLAIIGFALVAIIGVLPIGMNVQKDNREETIINQEVTVFMDAIRDGAQGVDDLTNYVMAITNEVRSYDYAQMTKTPPLLVGRYGYTLTNSDTPKQFPLNNGSRIVGLLSTPKYVLWQNDGGFYSNHVVAYVRSLSGPANEKFPQNNGDVQDFAFSYLMTSEVMLYWTNYVDASWVNFAQSGLSTNEITVRSNYWVVAKNLQANLHDVRLVFRWPLHSQGRSGQSGQSFRTLVGGTLQETNEPGFLRPIQSQPSPYDLYFFQPRTYVKAP
jgi:type II secretory pathway pseudopilin PulG